MEELENRVQELLAQMTLEEKVALTCGGSMWTTRAVERLGVPAIYLCDGPNGVRRPPGEGEIGIGNSLPATCFPTGSALASSWDPDLVREVGAAIGAECQALNVQVLLAPGMNIKRTPLCGRNFEYYSEDPVLAGEIAAAFVQGVQSQGVGACPKHYACNNQEYERLTIDARVDERTLREIYLAAFERVVKQGQPWMVMAAYNRVNGTHAAEHPWLLREVLKGEWGFAGAVVSDWGAVADRAASLQAGLDLEMPYSGEAANARIVRLVREGLLPESVVDAAAARVLALVLKGAAQRRPDATFDPEAHHTLARRAAAECMVLLKNEGGLLPLDPGRLARVAVIGRFAEAPRFQGGGSAHVRPTRVDSPLAELKRLLGDRVAVQYAPGYPAADGEGEDALIQEAVAAARAADVAIVFAGLPEKAESEGYDRPHLDLPTAHNRLIAAVARAQPRTVVVLMNGSAVTMPWLGTVPAVLEAWLGGQAVGGAVADVLLGRVNPSGKLAETFPACLEQTPAYLNYPGEAGQVRYGEGIFVGYRYYDKTGIKPLFPFGHGLSYTTFAYTGLALSRQTLTDQETLEVTVTVRNTGPWAGKEVVQLYVRDVACTVARPVQELKAFAKVYLEAGEERQVRFTLTGRDFAYWCPERQAWHVESGEFEIRVGPSSAETPLRAVVTVQSTAPARPFTAGTLFKHYAANPVALATLQEALADPWHSVSDHFWIFAMDMPLTKVVRFLTRGSAPEGLAEDLARRVNAALGIPDSGA